ncbi:hypothetical protein D3C75_127140 [compost metagenome]
MAQPVFVITIFKVFTGVSTAGLFTYFGRDGGSFSHFQQVLQFQRFDTCSVERLRLIVDLHVGDTLAQIGQLSDTLLHVFASTEYTEVVLHAALQLATQGSDVFAVSTVVQCVQARQGSFDVGFGSVVVFDAVGQRLFQVQAGSTAEYHQVEQRVAAQTVGTVNRYASHFTYREQTRNDLIHAIGVLGDRLAMDVGGNAAHHIVASRNNRNRRNNRVNVGESLRQFADAWQTAVQHFLAQVVEFEHHVVAIRTATVAGDDFFNHRASNHVTTGKVFGVRSITLHETLAVLVDQVSTFTTAAFCNQYTGAGDAGRVELPHFDVLYRYASTQSHADAVTGVDQGVGGGSVDTTCTAGSQYGGFGADVGSFASFDADRDHTDEIAFLVLHQVDSVVLVQERGTGFQVALIKGVQQGVTGTVGSRASTRSLAAFTVVLGLTTERTLVDTALFGTRERQTHVVQLENRGRAFLTHVFDSVLVTDVVGALDGIVHVPAPVIVRVSRRDRARDAALSGYSVRTGRENLGDHGSLVTTLRQLQRSAHAGTATTNNDGVERNRWNVSHESDTPENLHTPDEVSEHRNAAYCLEKETYSGRGLAERHWRQVVGRDGPHADPGVSAQSNKGQEAENTHPVVGEQFMPLGILEARVGHDVSDQKDEVSRENDRRHTLRHPVIEARTRQVRDVSYHIQTPARTITTTETAITIFEPSLPPSSVSPMPMSMIKWRTPATR